jgi:3-dehydrosphinganine reductase
VSGRFEGQLALVTGGSSGIGLALARQLAAEGADVSILARRQQQLKAAAEEIQAARSRPEATIGMISADVTEPRDVERAIAGLPRIPDLLINCAGVAKPGYAQELELDVFHWMMSVNYFGTVYATQSLLPALLARGSGHIVNIASLAGLLGVYGYTAYGASKFAVRGYSDVLRAELKPHGVRVSLVFPPDVDTPQLAYENQFKPPETKLLAGGGGVLSPEQAARAILNGVAGGSYIIIPGIEGKLLYWLSGWLGTAVYPLMDFAVRWARRRAAGSGGQPERGSTKGVS